ncbi:MAG: FAD-dependent monooxygenase [Agathobacter sp.]|nr:FAD-dependent monooxygenase [Agathobacter sp.]
MIKINQLKLPVEHTEAELTEKIKRTLKIKEHTDFSYKILKKSLDARKKPQLFYVYAIGVELLKEENIAKHIHIPNVSVEKPRTYQLPKRPVQQNFKRPLIIGAGPAGLFCAYLLCECGINPIVIERGAPMEERVDAVNLFWQTGVLDTESNVQFGEGGAGTFSDGKLNTAVKDPALRNPFVLDTFIRFGAPEAIRYENKPHIGTDILANVIVNMRNYLIEHGCTFHFHTCARKFQIKGGQITGVACNNGMEFEADMVVLALGHSARDTFAELNDAKLCMTVKNFAVGFRVEHPQAMINEAMYGQNRDDLPAAPYKVTSNFPNGRGVYSFCMCPGGYVVNSSSEEGELVVNGMSYSGRHAANANSAIIISVDPRDFGADDALAGMRFQRALEKKAYDLGNGYIPQQLYGDYLTGQKSVSYGDYASCVKGKTEFTNLRGLFSENMEQSFCLGMEHFAKIIPGYDRRDAILSGVESRTSSPLRMVRDEKLQSNIKGIYPCGEGAGYAGGIMSAAMDGMKVAEAILQEIDN